MKRNLNKGRGCDGDEFEESECLDPRPRQQGEEAIIVMEPVDLGYSATRSTDARTLRKAVQKGNVVMTLDEKRRDEKNRCKPRLINEPVELSVLLAEPIKDRKIKEGAEVKITYGCRVLHHSNKRKYNRIRKKTKLRKCKGMEKGETKTSSRQTRSSSACQHFHR